MSRLVDILRVAGIAAIIISILVGIVLFEIGPFAAFVQHCVKPAANHWMDYWQVSR